MEGGGHPLEMRFVGVENVYRLCWRRQVRCWKETIQGKQWLPVTFPVSSYNWILKCKLNYWQCTMLRFLVWRMLKSCGILVLQNWKWFPPRDSLLYSTPFCTSWNLQCINRTLWPSFLEQSKRWNLNQNGLEATRWSNFNCQRYMREQWKS